MFKPVRMCKLECVVSKEKKDIVMSRLHREGLAQLEYLNDVDLEKIECSRDNPLERAREVSALLLRVREIIERLESYDVSRSSFVEELLGVEKIDGKHLTN